MAGLGWTPPHKLLDISWWETLRQTCPGADTPLTVLEDMIYVLWKCLFVHSWHFHSNPRPGVCLMQTDFMRQFLSNTKLPLGHFSFCGDSVAELAEIKSTTWWNNVKVNGATIKTHSVIWATWIQNNQRMRNVRGVTKANIQLKADRPHPRNYQQTPADYRHTDRHFRLIITLLCYLMHSSP